VVIRIVFRFERTLELREVFHQRTLSLLREAFLSGVDQSFPTLGHLSLETW
jgi:hypothetical protein